MNRGVSDRVDGAQPRQGAAAAEILIAHSGARRETMELSQLRVLCIGIVGSIVADLFILIYFGVI